MTGRRFLAVTAVACALLSALPCFAEEGGRDAGRWRTRMRLDAILRWAPRYVIETEQTAWGADRLFWRRVDTLPLYLRVGLDTRWAQQDGPMSADIHAAAWAGLDTMFGYDEQGGLVAGDFAVAYGRFTYRPVAFWAGRRFVPWGPPGGMHIDGGGVGLSTSFGLTGDVVVGRPVTPIYESLLGVQPRFEGATLAYGVRLGYRRTGVVSASVAYTERWAEGIAADRLISAEVTSTPHRILDLRGNIVFDPAELAVEQAGAQAYVTVTRWLELDASYAFCDPTRLIPRWSILASFASGAFHEAGVGTSWTLSESHQIRAEGAVRRYLVPGQDDVEKWWGYRVDLLYRWVPRHRRWTVRAGASRRSDDEAALTLIQGAVSWAVGRRIQMAFDAAVAIDDDREHARDAYLARATIEAQLAEEWSLGFSLDGARTTFVEAELRGMLRATWRPTWGGAR